MFSRRDFKDFLEVVGERGVLDSMAVRSEGVGEDLGGASFGKMILELLRLKKADFGNETILFWGTMVVAEAATQFVEVRVAILGTLKFGLGL